MPGIFPPTTTLSRFIPTTNYYEGRATADLSPWLEYFLSTLATVFTAAKEEVLRLAREGLNVEPDALRLLDPRARAVLALFTHQDRITALDVANTLGLSSRTARLLLNDWVKTGWLVVGDPSRKGRTYELSAGYRQFIGRLSATEDLPGI